MRDRTCELRQGEDSSDEEGNERVALVIHPGTAKLGSPDEAFFQKVREIRQTMGKLENKVKELEKQQITILATPLPEDSMKQGLQNLREEIKQLGTEIRTQLKAIDPPKEGEDENQNSVNIRMRKTQHGVLSKQFVELINKCNVTQSEYREKNVERIQRQLKITNAGMVSEEEIEQMLETGQSEVFVSNILKDTQVTRQALNEISARHGEIQQLERSIRELHEIFTFLATEVEMQGPHPGSGSFGSVGKDTSPDSPGTGPPRKAARGPVGPLERRWGWCSPMAALPFLPWPHLSFPKPSSLLSSSLPKPCPSPPGGDD
ncbi:syntaxin-4 isoform X1 [Tachyglossus aculeatus]|uniref:syntaxin-4 isoform X1 n=1 Tax=Tachyglossus aculeatus TaxID=9261 RepID=UPI0018F63A06|nr:syntaxin-4 isoform X1 [Tachyglossus aculeatus]